jgi:hypothetical protein
MSLDRYHNSRSSDNVFKLLHEETSYLDILKGNVKAVYKDEIEEEETGETHSDVRQQLLHEQDDAAGASETEAEKKVEDDQGTPEQQEKAVEKEAVPKGAEVDKEMGVKEESVEQQIRSELKEISIAVARQGAARIAKQRALATRGMLRTKGPLKKAAAAKKFVPGLRG